MCLDTAFGATHDLGGLGHVELFPVTQQEGFALTRRQLHDFVFNFVKGLGAAGAVLGTFDLLRVVNSGKSFKKIKFAIFRCRFEVSKVREESAAGLLAAKPVEKNSEASLP